MASGCNDSDGLCQARACLANRTGLSFQSRTAGEGDREISPVIDACRSKRVSQHQGAWLVWLASVVALRHSRSPCVILISGYRQCRFRAERGPVTVLFLLLKKSSA